MKKRILILILSFVLLPINIFGITSSGTVSDDNKALLYPFGDEYCNNNVEEGFYYSGSVFLRDSNTSEEAIDEKKFIVSKETYKEKVTARKACDTFVGSNDNKNKTLLCKEPKRIDIAYSCSGELKYLKDDEKHLESYLTGNLLFDTAEECKKDCKGTCSMSSGYKYQYVELKDAVVSDGAIELVSGRMYQDSNGNYAFCLQPSKTFTCTGNKAPQYCLNTEFDLSKCKDDYHGDYKCGLAYIALKGINNRKTLTADEYGVIDVAMRMWAAKMGNIAGTNSTLPLPGGKTTSINFYAITAQRVMEDVNYLNNGLVCSKNLKNNGVLCTNGTNNKSLYKEALKLYNAASEAISFDADGNKVPRLISKVLRDSGGTIQITNPTGSSCEVNDPNCRVSITLYDRNGNIVNGNEHYCDKNYCYAVYKTESLCMNNEDTDLKIAIEIKDFDISGSVKEYHHCTNEDKNQIMFVIDASGTETTQIDYYNEYTVSLSCACQDDSDKLKATRSKTNSCENIEKANSDKSDYDGVTTSYIKDPSMATILNSCEGKKYFRATEFEVYSDTCKVYCRNETEIFTPTKARVYSGMQFRYELENLVKESLKSDYHITSIVRQKKECVSEIDYDTWKKRYAEAQKEVAKAWNDWKKLDVMAYKQEEDENYPKVKLDVIKCTACDASRCSYNSTSAIASESLEAGEVCKSLGDNYWYPGKNKPKVSGYCPPNCVESYIWTPVEYYSANGEITQSEEVVSSSNKKHESSLSCIANLNWNFSSTDTKYKYNKEDCDTLVQDNYNCKITADDIGNYACKCSKLVNKSGNDSDSYKITLTSNKSKGFELNEELLKHCASLKEKHNIGYNQSGVKCWHESNGNCDLHGENGDINHVREQIDKARAAYNKAQSTVRQLLNEIQACNFYGSGLGELIAGEPDIINYTLTRDGGTPSREGPGGGVGATQTESGGNEAAKVGPGGIASIPSLNIVDKNIKNVSTDELETDSNYAATTMLSTSEDYAISNIATTSNKDSIKKKILASISCLDGNCPDLVVEYGQEHYGKGKLPKEQYGAPQQYRKVVGVVVDENDIANKYCKGANCYCKGDDCDTSANDAELKKEDGWIDESYTENVERIVCNINGKPYEHKCQSIDTEVPTNNYVSFKATTEVDFYRHNSYYAEVYTGNIIDSNLSTTISNNNYTKLGNNVYPITNDSHRYKDRNITHKVKFSFSNLGIGNFSNNAVNIDSYDYECSYEVYNNTTGYDCVGDCRNECLEINENVPDLSCIKWESSGPKDYGFTFRNVDLSVLFPNRDPGYNWSQSTELIKDIQNSSNSIYKDNDNEYLKLSVTLDANAIKKIREYNRFKNDAGGYQDNSLRDCSTVSSIGYNNMRFANCRSSFIDELDEQNGALGIKVNKIVRGGGEIE